MDWFRKTWIWWVAVLLGLSLRLAWAQWIVDGRRFPEDPLNPGPGRTFPVLVLELGGVWTDFELKASVDNFETLVYYIRSSDLVVDAGDPDVWIYFTDDISMNPRKWRKAEVGVPILDQLVNPANSEVAFVVVCPSHETAVDWSTWMFESNSQLVWSYVRYDGATLEMNNVNSNAKWRSLVPVTWRSERISP